MVRSSEALTHPHGKTHVLTAQGAERIAELIDDGSYYEPHSGFTSHLATCERLEQITTAITRNLAPRL